MSETASKVKSSAWWLILGNLLVRGLSLCATVVTARLLLPEDFGLVSLAASVWGLFLTIFSLGVGAAVIQNKQPDPRFLDTAFWLNLLALGVLLALSVLLAGAAAAYYRTPRLPLVIYCFAAAGFFSGLTVVHEALINREMAFKTLSVFNIALQAMDTGGTILLAVLGLGFWSLVLPKLLIAPLRGGLFWWACPWRPRRAFSADLAKKILSFSLKLQAASLLGFININADFLIVGKVLGQALLGFYTFAYNSAQWPITNFIFLVNSLALPYFSRLQEDRPRLQEQYLKMVRLISVVTFPFFLGAALVAPEGIPLIFGEKWRPAVLAFQFLCLFGAVRSIGSPGGQVMTAVGRPELMMIFNLVQAPFLITGILLGTRFGITGVAAASLIVLGTGGLVFIGLTLRCISLEAARLISALAPAAAAAAVMAVALLAGRVVYFRAAPSPLIFFLSAVAGGIVVYFTFFWLAFPGRFREAREVGLSSLREFLYSRRQSLTIKGGGGG